MDIENEEGFYHLKSINNNSIDLILTDPPYITSSETGMDNLHKQQERKEKNRISKNRRRLGKRKDKKYNRNDCRKNERKLYEICFNLR